MMARLREIELGVLAEVVDRLAHEHAAIPVVELLRHAVERGPPHVVCPAGVVPRCLMLAEVLVLEVVAQVGQPGCRTRVLLGRGRSRAWFGPRKCVGSTAGSERGAMELERRGVGWRQWP